MNRTIASLTARERPVNDELVRQVERAREWSGQVTARATGALPSRFIESAAVVSTPGTGWSSGVCGRGGEEPSRAVECRPSLGFAALRLLAILGVLIVVFVLVRAVTWGK